MCKSTHFFHSRLRATYKRCNTPRKFVNLVRVNAPAGCIKTLYIHTFENIRHFVKNTSHIF
ncbi:MAG: hypothetical protein DBY24_07770 [Prevotellaceae bacterium]|nr:MAG: hypothetical protein DBY24_07770 [Prevotellaceae bacterium]